MASLLNSVNLLPIHHFLSRRFHHLTDGFDLGFVQMSFCIFYLKK
jgi:hypothetical protein